MTDGEAVLQVREIAEVLAAHGQLLCAARVDMDDGHAVLTLEAGGDLSVLELFHALRYVVDMGQMRALCGRYGIEPAMLERMLPPQPGDPCAACDAPWEEHLVTDSGARGRHANGMFHYFERKVSRGA